MPAVVIVDDHLLLAETVREALRRRGFEAETVSPGPATDLMTQLLAAAPDLVLLDLDLGAAGTGTSLIPALVAAGVRVLLVTGVEDRLRIAEAMELGALGYQPKAAGFEALVEAACTAATAAGPLDPAGRATLLRELRAARTEREQELAPFHRLTERERETLRALGEGRSVRQIADDWVVSEATVRSHVRSLLSKLGDASQLQAVARATRGGWFRRDGARVDRATSVDRPTRAARPAALDRSDQASDAR